MIRLVFSNQRGGVAKTTSAHTFARFLADKGKRVLLIDTDPQGSVQSVLGLKPKWHFYEFLNGYSLKECVVEPHPNLHVMCSNRDTAKGELILNATIGREFVLQKLLTPIESEFDAILIDVAPSISIIQTCALIYAQRFVMPVAMDPLSLQGVGASVEAARLLNMIFPGLHIKALAMLPVMVDRRFSMTEVVIKSLESISTSLAIPMLHAIRSDANVSRAASRKKFLLDQDPKGKAIEDYQIACEELLALIERDKLDGEIAA